MTKNLLPISLLAILFIMGCNEPLPITENKTMILEINQVQNNNGYLLTREEAHQALLEPEFDESEKIRIFNEGLSEEKRAESELTQEIQERIWQLRETVMDEEDREQAISKLNQEWNKRYRALLDHYHAISEKEIREIFDELPAIDQEFIKFQDEMSERWKLCETIVDEEEREQAINKLIEERDERHREYITRLKEEDSKLEYSSTHGWHVRKEPQLGGWGPTSVNPFIKWREFLVPYADWKDEDIENIDDWECHLKEGLFQSGREAHGFIAYGRFTQGENGEWIATILSYELTLPHGSYGGFFPSE